MHWLIFNMLLINLHLVERASGQTIYDAHKFYKPMTEDYDVRSNGNLFMPVCMKELLNCWELVRADLVCKYRPYYRVALESICMDLRFHCREYTGPLPIKNLEVVTWNYCKTNINDHYNIQMVPNGKGINQFNNWS